MRNGIKKCTIWFLMPNKSYWGIVGWLSACENVGRDRTAIHDPGFLRSITPPRCPPALPLWPSESGLLRAYIRERLWWGFLHGEICCLASGLCGAVTSILAGIATVS